MNSASIAPESSTELRAKYRWALERPILLLTLHQPWATFMAAGLKGIETRSWRTTFSGLVAIHAGKNKESLDLLRYDPHFANGLATASHILPNRWCLDAERPHSDDFMPLGAIVAIGHLEKCERVEFIRPQLQDNSPELVFGNFGSGRYGWMFDRIVPLEVPIPQRGYQGIHFVGDTVLQGALRDRFVHGPATFPRAA